MTVPDICEMPVSHIAKSSVSCPPFPVEPLTAPSLCGIHSESDRV